jgi:hypothetical protein
MGNVHAGVPPRLTRDLAASLGLGTAVETGTFQGHSARLLAGIFPTVHTIELSTELAAAAHESLGELGNVTVHQGSSVGLLGSLVSEAVGPQFYWLDGHWSGGVTAGVENECPVLEEIRIIDRGDYAADSVILVDDARLFLLPPPPPHNRAHWPSLTELLDTLREKHNRYVTVVQDVVVAVPPAARRVVEDYGMSGEVRSPHERRLPARLRARLRSGTDRPA